jgi:hypothetical protein
MAPRRRGKGPVGTPGLRQKATALSVEAASLTVAPETVTWLGEARRRRQEAAGRLAPLPCGCCDPLLCDLRRDCPFWDGRRRQGAAR